MFTVTKKEIKQIFVNIFLHRDKKKVLRAGILGLVIILKLTGLALDLIHFSNKVMRSMHCQKRYKTNIVGERVYLSFFLFILETRIYFCSNNQLSFCIYFPSLKFYIKKMLPTFDRMAKSID